MVRWPFVRRLEPQDAYALWAAAYPPRAHNPLMWLEQQTVLRLLPEVAGLTVLDAGCGTGRYLRELRERGARAAGIDLSDAMLARAREVAGPLARANLSALPVRTQAVDLVVCALALGDVPHLAPALIEMARVLRPGGSVVYSVVHPAGGPGGWLRTFENSGQQFAIDSYWHTAAEHRLACDAAGLRITAWEEPALAEAPRHPAILVVRGSR